MSDLAQRKALLRQQISNDRQLLELEAEGMRERLKSARQMLRIGSDLARPVGAAVAMAASAVGTGALSKAKNVKGVSKAGAGGLVGLAALIPIAITVAKAVASMRERKADSSEDEGAPDAEAGADVTSESEGGGES